MKVSVGSPLESRAYVEKYPQWLTTYQWTFCLYLKYLRVGSLLSDSSYSSIHALTIHSLIYLCINLNPVNWMISIRCLCIHEFVHFQVLFCFIHYTDGACIISADQNFRIFSVTTKFSTQYELCFCKSFNEKCLLDNLLPHHPNWV